MRLRRLLVLQVMLELGDCPLLMWRHVALSPLLPYQQATLMLLLLLLHGSAWR